MHAFKFLDSSGRSPFVGTEWKPGEWVEAPSARQCVIGVHACLAPDLARWLSDALWEVELDGDVVLAEHKVVARRGRLVRPVSNYPEVVSELAEVGAWRSRDRAAGAMRSAGDAEGADRLEAVSTLEALVDVGGAADDGEPVGRAAALAGDAAHFALRGDPSQSPFVAACSAGHARAGGHGDQSVYDAGYEAERQFQSTWLTEHLDLDG